MRLYVIEETKESCGLMPDGYRSLVTMEDRAIEAFNKKAKVYFVDLKEVTEMKVEVKTGE